MSGSAKLREVVLECPVDPEALADLRSGDLVFLEGPIFTGREGVYKRFLAEGIEPPVPWSSMSNVNFHCSPAATYDEKTGFSVASVSATASFRFGKWMPDWLDRTGVKVIVGKGGMALEDYRDILVPRGAVYLTTMGYGLGATYGRGIRGVRAVHWLEELGIAQAIWVLDRARMGPFLVESDLQGNSVFEASNRVINARLASLYEGLPLPALGRYGETTNRNDELL